MSRPVSRIVGVLGVLLWAVGAAEAADPNKALSETEGRKRAAENGLKEIKAKGEPSDDVRRAYLEAASQQNVCLETVCQAVEEGATAAPIVAAKAQNAAASLVAWVSLRNRALGLPDLTGASADSVRKGVVQDLVEIATATWRNNRTPDAKRRASAAAALKARLQWRAFEEM